MKAITILGYTIIKACELNDIIKKANDSKDSATILRAKKYLAEEELKKCKIVLQIKNHQIESLSKKSYKNGRFIKETLL